MSIFGGSCFDGLAWLDIGAGVAVVLALFHARGLSSGPAVSWWYSSSYQFFLQIRGSSIGYHRGEGEGFLEVGVLHHDPPMFLEDFREGWEGRVVLY